MKLPYHHHPYDAFPVKDLQKGLAYFEEGRIQNFHITGDSGIPLILADVQGTAKKPYAVSLRMEASLLTGRCTCPYYRYGNPCKHMAAVLIAAMDILNQSPTNCPQKQETSFLYDYLRSEQDKLLHDNDQDDQQDAWI